MTTNIKIANQALRRLGANPILAFSDPTAEGLLVNDTYEEIRDDLLRDHPWNFALRRESLAASATAPVWGYERAFPVPADFLRLIEVNEQSYYDVKVESIDGVGTVFVTDMAAPLKILYVARVEDPSQYDPKFRKALMLRCALEWAEPLTASSSVLEAVAAEFDRAWMDATRADGQEGTPAQLSPVTWTRARV